VVSVTPEDYVDLDEPYELPELLPVKDEAGNVVGQFPRKLTKRQMLRRLAERHRCEVGQLSDEVLEVWGFTSLERATAAMDAAEARALALGNAHPDRVVDELLADVAGEPEPAA
jgi:hypothetical protein